MASRWLFFLIDEHACNRVVDSLNNVTWTRVPVGRRSVQHEGY